MFSGLAVFKTNWEWPKIFQAVNALEGEVYTFSFYLKSPDNAKVQIYTNGTTGVTDLHGAYSFDATNEWRRYSFVAHVTTSGDLNFRPETPNKQQMYVCGYKLEYGENTETVWTPAPQDFEDIYTRLTTLEEAAKEQSAP